MALIRSTIYQQDLRRFHARNVKSRAFQEGDLVLRVDQQKPHKLAPTWEGPFIVTKVLHNGAYRLYNVEHQIDEPRAWNSTIYQQDLRRFHARNVKSRAFQEGDLVLRVDQQKPHKLAPTWEGPFIVTKVLHNGAYRLYNVEHQIDEPRAWNSELLRPFYT